ncbi:CDP-alcohol phosphatidyltransferase family protein [Candidatus Woesearchaeota archaeon]|nr:CDP-alcohol phosphatidyltransferase family protein [Candidatus Woesearchaeota archaeon]
MIKEKYYPKKIYRIIGKTLSLLPFGPYFYTGLSFLLGAAGLLFSFSQNIITAFFCFALSGFLDICDGALAKYMKKTSEMGAFIDGVSDRFVDFFLVFSFLLLDLPDIILPNAYLLSILMFITIMPSFIVAYANHKKIVSDTEETKIWRIMHRGEMYAAYLAALLMAAFNKSYSVYLLLFIALLNLITIAQTIVLSFRYSKHK